MTVLIDPCKLSREVEWSYCSVLVTSDLLEKRRDKLRLMIFVLTRSKDLSCQIPNPSLSIDMTSNTSRYSPDINKERALFLAHAWDSSNLLGVISRENASGDDVLSYIEY